MKRLLALGSIVFLLFAADAGADYATKVLIGEDVELSLYTERMFRVRVSKLDGETFPPRYEIPFAIGHLEDWAPVPFERWQDGGYDHVETSAIRIRIGPDRAWTVWTRGGAEPIYPSDGPIYGMFRDGYTLFDSASAFGERNNNSRYAHWFFDPSTGRYVDTYLAEDLIFDEYFIYGPDYESLFAQLNALVGPEPVLPKKAYGFFQTQHLECDGDQTKLMALARRLRERGIPVDTLIIDFEWGDGCPGEEEENWGRLEWAPAYSAPLTPEAMLAELDEMHFDVMLIHHNAPDFPHRAEHTPTRVRDWTSKVYDEALWWEILEGQLAIGVDGTWQDTRQNDVTDSVIWNGFRDYWGDERRVLFMGCRKMMDLNPFEHDRDNTIPANNLIGSRRYPFRWTGDIGRTYREMKWQVGAITNTHGSMKSISHLVADTYAKDAKLYARWNQFVDFLPVTRSHTMKPWEFGEETEENIRRHRELRYRLIPYIYTTAHESYQTGMPMTRPMLLAFSDDQRCERNQWPYQYMFGDSLLVAPVYADLASMEIYLPEGSEWIDYWSEETYEGGQVIDYETSNTGDTGVLPLFVRAGAILPMQEDVLWIDPSKPTDPLVLDIYPSGTSSFTLYEDDGVSTRYQSGAFTTTPIESREGARALEVVLGASEGVYAGKPAERGYLMRIHGIERSPDAVTRDSMSVPIDYDRDARVLSIRFRAETSSVTTIAVRSNP